MRKKIVAGNWKMNKFLAEGVQLAADILMQLNGQQVEHTVILCPPFIHLTELVKTLSRQKDIKLGAQNCYYEDSGAFTGEVSAPMLSSIGIDYIILGHSERRQIFQESNEMITKKVKAVLEHGLKPIFCCGEPLDIRETDRHKEYVEKQVSDSLFGLSKEELKNVVIAYEPIWAIGTGKNATPEQAQKMHQYIRQLLTGKYGEETGENISILYGGSVKPDNARELFTQPDVDGGLIGGASLKAEDFVAIINCLS